ncbi:MAG TPA: hypothetical protein VIC57_11150, partial [Candidatus Dormibacteraeota bacterium]
IEPSITIDLLAAWTTGVRSAPGPLTVPLERVTATIVEAGTDGGYERVTVSLDGGEQLGIPLLQYWTLERGSAAALRGQACWTCGAPLRLDQRGRCVSCAATIDLGRLGWVLTRLESARDWSSRQLAPGQTTLEALDAIAAEDPGFNAEVFTDRVIALYPRLALATRDPSCALARVAIAPVLRRRLERERSERSERAGTEPELVAVTGAAISHAAHWADGDSVTVDLSGTVTDVRAGADEKRAPSDWRVPQIVDRWTFFRHAGVETSGAGGVLTETCTACGAPIDIDDRGCCSHCGTAITLGNHDWTLIGMTRGWTQPEPPPADETVDDDAPTRRWEGAGSAGRPLMRFALMEGWSPEGGSAPDRIVLRPDARLPRDASTAIVVIVEPASESVPATARAAALRDADVRGGALRSVDGVEATGLAGVEAARYAVEDARGIRTENVVCAHGGLVYRIQLTAPADEFAAIRDGQFATFIASTRFD